MRLKKVRVRGFQSFSDSGEIEFREGFNLVIGQNNSGKSSLLRALLPTISDDRHRSPQEWERAKLPEPQIDLTIAASGLEIRDWIFRQGSPRYIPVQPGQDISDYIEKFWNDPAIEVSVSHSVSQSFISHYPSHNKFTSQNGEQQICALVEPRNGKIYVANQYRSDDSLPEILRLAWQSEMFYFSAERLVIGESGPSYSERLAPNASNLPNVLHTLQNERGILFRKLVGHINEIFPTVGNLSIRLRPENHNFEIRVWPTTEMERVDLSFPLNSSGTGVAQAVAILTAVMTINNSVIVIDEINSFLHPLAVKSLLRVLRINYPNNQYIVSTHAPEVISFSNPSSLHLVKRDGYESIVEKLDIGEVNKFREIAQHIGVSMADVFAAERVIWVEGQTEEVVFPLIFKEFSGSTLPAGTVMTSVLATGDFNRRRDREIVYEIYRRLSQSAATLVVSTVFSFDSEELSEKEKEEMKREAKEGLYFLPRRHLECYLVNPHAIANMINERDSGSEAKVKSEIVAEKISQLSGERKFKIQEWGGDIGDQDWLSKVDAANLIAEAIADLTDGRVTYDKKQDSAELVKFILTEDRDSLQPLFQYVKLLVEAASK